MSSIFFEIASEECKCNELDIPGNRERGAQMQ
jgi:hypothetical protein